MTVRVLFCHGLESGPLGRKVVGLREAGFAVTAPDMEMSLFNPARRNSVVRSLLSPSALLTRWPSDWLRLALADSFDACVDVQRAALADGEHDVLLGSSWGGAVAAALVAEGAWSGPALLLCPALSKLEQRGVARAGTIATRLGALDAAQRKRTLIVHGDADDTIPLADSEAIASRSGDEDCEAASSVEAMTGRLAGVSARIWLPRATQTTAPSDVSAGAGGAAE